MKSYIDETNARARSGQTILDQGKEAPVIKHENVDTHEKPAVAAELMDFSAALALVKAGARVCRAGWNGKGMFIFLVPGSRFQVNRQPLLDILGEGTWVDYHGHVDMKTANGQIVPWLCSQTDLLADDWMLHQVEK